MSPDTFAKNFVTKSLGLLWLFDGLLQFQPRMFGPDFVSNVLAPTLSGQPSFMHAIISFGIYLWSTNTVVTNTAAALLQIAIGVLLLFALSSKKCRFGLWISILWGILVWLCGEGAGMLLTGDASVYTGAPGAALIYALLAAFLLCGEKVTMRWYPKLAGWILVLSALLQLQPTSWTADGVQDIFSMSMMDPVHAIAAAPTYLSNLFGLYPLASNAALLGIPLLVGLALLLKPNRITGSIALAFLFAVWWLGQDFGQLTTFITGTSTDPSGAPLLALCLAPLFISLRAGERSVLNLKRAQEPA